MSKDLVLPLLERRRGVEDGLVIGVDALEGDGMEYADRLAELLHGAGTEGQGEMLALARHLGELPGEFRRAACHPFYACRIAWMRSASIAPVSRSTACCVSLFRFASTAL